MSEDPIHVPEDRLFLALVKNDAFSTMPELLKILGQEKFLELVEVFGGLALQIPNLSDLRQSLRDLAIYERNVNEGVAVALLAEEYEMTPRSIRRIVANVDKAYNFGAQGPVHVKDS